MNNIAADFPVLNNGCAYLDNAATTHSPKAVVDAMVCYYSSSHSNVHSGVHYLSEKATKLYKDSRKTIADFINADDIVLCSGTTAAINTIVFGYAKNIVKSGSEIIVSGMEHHANLIPWQVLAKELNLTLKIIPVLKNGELDLDCYSQMLSDKTAFVSLTHVSNVLGTINPIKEMTLRAKKFGAKVLIDGAQAVAHTKVDVKDIGCDFYAFSAHKIYGPTGIGALYINKDLLSKVTPVNFGGGMIEYVAYDEAEIIKDDVARLEAGTPNISGAVGFAAAIEYFVSLGIDNILKHEQDLLSYANKKLSEFSEVTIYGNSSNKAGVLSFTVADVHAHDITSLLNEINVAVRGGHHCAMPLVKSFGLSSLTRASFGIYNTRDDIDRLCLGIANIKKVFQL
jgi:cysteine desulfurase/selenocysteine lyase